MSTSVKTYRIRLNISAEEWLSYYRGQANRVSCQADDGTRIELPAENLRKYVTSSGIKGIFLLQISSDNKFLSLNP